MDAKEIKKEAPEVKKHTPGDQESQYEQQATAEEVKQATKEMNDIGAPGEEY